LEYCLILQNQLIIQVQIDDISNTLELILQRKNDARNKILKLFRSLPTTKERPEIRELLKKQDLKFSKALYAMLSYCLSSPLDCLV